MNKVFKTMWNAAKGMFVVVNEKTGCGQSCGFSQKLKGGRVNPYVSGFTAEQGLFRTNFRHAFFGVCIGMLSLNSVCAQDVDTVHYDEYLSCGKGANGCRLASRGLMLPETGPNVPPVDPSLNGFALMEGDLITKSYDYEESGVHFQEQWGMKQYDFSNFSNGVVEFSDRYTRLGLNDSTAAFVVHSDNSVYPCSFNNFGGGDFVIKGGEKVSDHITGKANGLILDGLLSVNINNENGRFAFVGVIGHGVYRLTGYKSPTTLHNKRGAEFYIVGNVEHGSFGVEQLLNDAQSSVTMINEGRFVFGHNAIGSFGGANADGSKIFINKSTGKVETVLDAMFAGGTFVDTPTLVDIALINVQDDSLDSQSVEGGSIKNAEGWILKDDWKNHAQFDAGGNIIFTDVYEGTTGAVDIQKQFEAAFGTGSTIQFAQRPEDGPLTLTVSKINDILSAKPTVLLHTTAFDSDQTNLIVGDASSLTGSIGLKQLNNTDTVLIKQNNTFTLLGDGNRVTTATTTVEQGGTLALGHVSKHLTDAQGGVIGSITNHGLVDVNTGKFHTATLTANGSLNIDADGAFTTDQYAGKGAITNKGTFVANAGAVTGDVSSSGVIKVESYKGDANSKFTSTGTLVADSFSTDGFTYFSKDSMLAIGDIDQQTTFFLENLDIAKKVVEAGGTVHQKVIDALKAQGMISANFTLASAEDRLLEEESTEEGKTEAQKPEANKDPVIAQSSARRVISTVSREGRLAASALIATAHNTARMESEVFAGTSGLWVDVGGAKDEFDAYKSDRYGLMLGYQAYDERNGLTFGLVGRYADGKLKGAELAQDDWTSMGASVYAGWQNDKFFTLGSLGFDQQEAEGQNKINLDAFTGTAKIGMKLPLGSMMLSPFVGVEAVHFSVDEADSTTTWRLPIGVRASGQYQTWGGWMMHPAMSIAFVPQSGDKTIVLDRGIESTFAGDYAVQTKVGFNAKKDNFMLGLTYSGMTGKEGLRSHALQARASYLF